MILNHRHILWQGQFLEGNQTEASDLEIKMSLALLVPAWSLESLDGHQGHAMPVIRACMYLAQVLLLMGHLWAVARSWVHGLLSVWLRLKVGRTGRTCRADGSISCPQAGDCVVSCLSSI